MFRKSLETSDWQEAKRKEKKLIADADAGKISASSVPFARMPFDEALELYRRDRKPNLSPTTQRSELDHGEPLKKCFGQTCLAKITEPMIRDYIAGRHKAGLSNPKINKEFYILRGMLKRAKRWHLFAEELKPLKVQPSKIGRALESEERDKLLKAGQLKPRWSRALLAAELSLNTTMRRSEVRKLQWKDVDLLEKSIYVQKGKSEERSIPMNPDALTAILKLREQAKKVFGDNLSPEWYVLFWWPASGDPDATRPTKGWRSAWRSMVKEAGVGSLRFHDLRHTAITDFAECAATDETIMSIAGHMDRRMMSHYSHIRKESKQAAVEALYRKNLRQGKDTAQVTAQPITLGDVLPAEAIEKNGGDDETRTRDLCRDRAAF